MSVRPLIIAGMARSGTTMLQQLCEAHNQMHVTNELGNYAFVGDSFPKYAARIAARIQKISGKWRIVGKAQGGMPTKLSNELRRRAENHVANAGAAAGHLARLARHWPRRVTLSALTTEAVRDDAQIRVIGDKLPLYTFMMDRFVDLPELRRLVIYRDCRDVTSSFLRKVRTDWRGQDWTRHADTAEKIARRWVRAIEVMESHASCLQIIRYEELVSDPPSGLRRLAEWLEVDSSGFDVDMVRDSSVGKYKQGLTAAEVEVVMGVAGTTLERLGYPLE